MPKSRAEIAIICENYNVDGYVTSVLGSTLGKLKDYGLEDAIILDIAEYLLLLIAANVDNPRIANAFKEVIEPAISKETN